MNYKGQVQYLHDHKVNEFLKNQKESSSTLVLWVRFIKIFVSFAWHRIGNVMYIAVNKYLAPVQTLFAS